MTTLIKKVQPSPLKKNVGIQRVFVIIYGGSKGVKE